MKHLLAAALLLLTACATSTRPSDSATLAKIANEWWQHQLAESPSLQVKFGLPTKHLPDPSYAHAEEDAKFAIEVGLRVDRIDASHLSDDERLTRRLLQWYAAMPADDLRLFWLRSPVTPYASPLRGVNQLFTAKKLDTAERVRLLREYGQFVNRLRNVVVEQRRRGYLLPKPELPLVRGMIAGFIKSPESSALRGGDDSADVRKAIANVVNPALQRLAAVFNDAYESQAPGSVGLSQYPGGAHAYRALIRRETSLDFPPETIHEMGLQEVARIGRELDDIRKEVGFSGTLAEFRRYLKTDPRFFAKSSEEIGDRLGTYVRRIEPQIPRFFAKSPRAAYDVKRLDPSLEGAMTFGYYQAPTATDPAGHYFYNGSKVNERNLLFAPALMLHELIPGHHFQINRQSENTSIPAFRRESFDTAFVEGWGEYSAWLGREMGIYDDPYDRAGRLMMDSLLSVRLVVDTGMNALGWSREKAMQYMRENTFQSDTEIATESLRYSVDIPAQALAYKIGSLKMIELRREAEKALGEKFDIREFHEWILGSGSMPLAILEEHVREQTAATK